MKYTKIRLPETDDGARAFAELARKYRVVGVREEGGIVYQVPADAVATLDDLSLPYEVLAVELATPMGPAGTQ
jgi:hypothetical protein